MRSLVLLSAGAAAAERPVIDVYLPGLPQTMQPALQNAQTVVMAVYAEIGLQVRWRMTGSQPFGCETIGGRARILVTAADHAPARECGRTQWLTPHQCRPKVRASPSCCSRNVNGTNRRCRTEKLEAFLALVVLAASYSPASRAARLHRMDGLREE